MPGKPGGLLAKVEELKEIAAKSNSPIQFEKEFRARELVERIRQLIEVGQVPEALQTYDLLYDLTRDEEIKKQKQRLTAQWKPRGTAHEQARNYVLGAWRRVENLPEFDTALKPLTDSVDVMIANNDALGLRNLISSMQPAYARLSTILENLDPNAEIDRKSVEKVRELSKVLRELEQKALAKVEKIEGGKK